MLRYLEAETLAVLRRRRQAIDNRADMSRELAEAKAAYERASRNMLAADPEDLPTLRLHLRELRGRVSALETSQTSTPTHTPESLVAAGLRNLNTPLVAG